MAEKKQFNVEPEAQVYLFDKRGNKKLAKAHVSVSAKFSNGQIADTLSFNMHEIVEQLKTRSLTADIQINGFKYWTSKKYREQIKLDHEKVLSNAYNQVGEQYVSFLRRRLMADNAARFEKSHPKLAKKLRDEENKRFF